MKYLKIDIADVIGFAGAGIICWGLYEVCKPAAIIFAGFVLIVIAVAKAKTGGE